MPKPAMTCPRLRAPESEVPAGELRRCVIGEDDAPRPFADGEVSDLQDELAQMILLNDSVDQPSTPRELLDALDGQIGADSEHPLHVSTERVFIVSETSQILRDDQETERVIRFILSRGAAPQSESPELILSIASSEADQSELIEVMAWDPANKGFNYYQTTTGGPGAWVWAGNSRHAFGERTRGEGPFEAHPSGNFLMKELKFPWVHWHSPAAPIEPRDLGPERKLLTHPWFLNKGNAYELEESVAKPAIRRWNAERVRLLAEKGRLGDPAPIFEQIVGSPREPEPRQPRPTVNIISSVTTWAQAQGGADVALPVTFFVDIDSFGALDISMSSDFSVAGETYVAAIEESNVRLEDSGSHNTALRLDRDTHFCFAVPERAFEDVDMLQQLLEADLVVSRRLALCLLLVDFPNPVFSEQRASLLVLIDGFEHDDLSAEACSQALGDHIASQNGAALAVAEFQGLWAIDPARIEAEAQTRLDSYLDAVRGRLASGEGLADYLRLASSRRRQHEDDLFIHEQDLLLPKGDAVAGLVMSRGGEVSG